MTWQSPVLRFAGATALLWAAALTVNPWASQWLGFDSHATVFLRWLMGVSGAVFGLGLLIASTNPVRHWPIVLLSLLQKTATSLVLGYSIWTGEASNRLLTLLVTDHLLWLIPLAWLLVDAHESLLGVRRRANPDILKLSMRRKTQDGMTLDELSRLSPVLLVFLRHTGCTFCREALADLAAKKRDIEEAGTRLVLVHMSSEQQAGKFFARYGLANVQRISDPERSLYRAFGLPRGTFSDLFGPKVWIRGFQAGILGRHGVGRLVGDGFQMPGAFLIYFGEVLRSYRHQSAADRPDYMALVTGREYAAPEIG